MQESGFRIWFLETGYFFSKILSEFRKKIVAQHLGSVAVRLWEETQNICVRIEDDGVGFDPENLDLAREVESAGQHNHIALTNVLRRLHLLYGDRADLQIRSKPGQGTTVLLTLPLDQTKG